LKIFNFTLALLFENKCELANFMSSIDVMAHCIPDLTYTLHKGSCGRIGVVGGSPEYTGAPYYAAISSLKFGADLTYVFCAQQAAAAIKAYSPEIMVVPVYDQVQVDSNNSALQLVDRVTQYFPRLHALVLGPGLGRDPNILRATERIIACALKVQLPLVLDADALFLLQSQQSLDVIRGNTRVILTPNIVEYKRLRTCVFGDDSKTKTTIGSKDDVEQLARALGGVTVVLKGEHDVVSNGSLTLVTNEIGGRKRSGGQGDILAGSIATACAWTRSSVEIFPHAAIFACTVVKIASRKAFNREFRAMTAPDIISVLGESFQSIFPTLPVEVEAKI